MGALLTSILQGAGRAGSEVQEAKTATTDQRLKAQQGKLGLDTAALQLQRLQQELQAGTRPQYKGFTTIGNKIYALTQNPDGSMAVKDFALGAGDDEFANAAHKAIDSITDPKRKQAAQDIWGMYASQGNYKEGFSAVKSEVDKADSEAGIEARANKYREDANQRAKDARAAADERQRKSQQFSKEQQQRGFNEREKLSSTLRNAGTNAVAVNSAIGAIDTIEKNADVLTNLLKASKIDLTIDPQGKVQSLISRGVTLTPQESAVATAFAALTEHVNLLRGPLGAQGFRGPEAFARLQAQRGNPLANPSVTLGVLNYTKRNLQGFQKVNERMLGPDVMQQLLAPPDATEAPLDLEPVAPGEPPPNE
jgi:hypothetical protein